MRENKYDNEQFFAQYSRMERSTQGLAGAGEWHALRRMLPDFRGKRVLDLGCGFGWHCRYAAEQGAAQVIGTDISERMLSRAREINSAPAIEYRRMAIEDLDFPAGAFDIVLSSLAFHYVESFAMIAEKVAGCLTPGGSFVFSVEHPIFTAQGAQAWHLDAAGNPSHWPVDRYFEEGARQAVFLGETVTKYHRTLATYLQTLLQSGFTLTHFTEPTPDPGLLAAHPEYADELRRPMFAIFAAVRC